MNPEKVITGLKGQFFLSPKERKFINFVTGELGISGEILGKALEECLKAIPPERRRNFPIFRCLRRVLELKKLHERKKALKKSFNWKSVFYQKLQKAESYLDELPKEPKTEEEAEKILREIESKIFKKLWGTLPIEERKRIVKKYRQFRNEDEELFKELVKYEIRKKYKIPELSLYVR